MGCSWWRSYAWFPPFHCRSAGAVSPFPIRKFRKNYRKRRKNYVVYEKNSVAPLPLPPAVAVPFRSNRIESYFAVLP